MTNSDLLRDSLLLLESIMSNYPVDGGGHCVKSAVFHSRMLNDFIPAYSRIVLDSKAYTPSDPDDETPLDTVVPPEGDNA